MASLEFSKFKSVPQEIIAVHVERAGFYELDGYPIHVDNDDTYIVKDSVGCYTHMTGIFFRQKWEPSK